MFSRNSQPIMEDIVSVFESTQNQPWSVFRDKLSRIPMETYKSKDIFKSENPIKLSFKNDFRVFGLIPRLEEIKLLSCGKCKMIVKEDCLQNHYYRRHNSVNDNFSLKSFLRPAVKSNKHKRQKLNVRKLPKKKIINCKIIDPIIEKETQVSYAKCPEMKENIKLATDIKYESDINFVIETHNPITNHHTWDTPSLVCYTDHKINDKKAESDVNQIQLSSVLQQRENYCYHYLNNDFSNSGDELTKSSNMNKEISPKIKMNCPNEDEKHKQINDKFKNLCHYCQLQHKLSTSEEKTKLVTSDDYSDVRSDNNSSNYMSNEVKEEINDNPQSSFGILNHKEETKNNPYPNNLSTTSDKCSCDSVISLYQSPKVSSNIKEGLIPKCSDVISNENFNNKNNDNLGIGYYEKICCKDLKKYLSRYKYPDMKNDKSSSDFSVNSFYQSSPIKEEFEFTPNYKFSEISSNKENNYGKFILPCSSLIPVEFMGEKICVQHKQICSLNGYSEVISDKYVNDSITSDYSSSISPCNFKVISTPKQNSECMNNESSNNENNKADDLCSRRKYKLLKDMIEIKGLCEIGLNDFSQLPSKFQNLVKEKISKQIDEKNSDITSNEKSDDTCSNFEESSTSILNEEKIKSKLFDYSNENMIDSGSSVDNKDNESYFLTEFINCESLPSFKPKLNEYSDLLNNYISDESVTSYDLKSVASLDDNEEINNLLTPTCSNIGIDENSYSITSNNESSIKLQIIKYETKYTQTDFKWNNYKQSINLISKVDIESLSESINVSCNKTKSTQTDLSINCNECCINTNNFLNSFIPVESCMNNVEIVEGFIDSYTSDNSNAQRAKNVIHSYITVKSDGQTSKYFVNSLAPITSSAQIIKNPIIPNSSIKYESSENDDSGEYISFDSYVPPFPNIPESQNNCLTRSPITGNTQSLENNDKVYNSETCADKQSDYILQHNTINGSLYCPIYKDCLKNTSDEKNEKSNVNSQNYEIDYTEAKFKNYLKKRYVHKIAYNKENHKKYTFKNRTKHYKMKFVVRSMVCSDESDNNDNVGE